MEEKQRKLQKLKHGDIGPETLCFPLESLPEELIHHIFSFLSGKEATVMATLSKTCYKHCPLIFSFDNPKYEHYNDHTLYDEAVSHLNEMVYESLSKISDGDATRKTLRLSLESRGFSLKSRELYLHIPNWLELARIKNFTDIILCITSCCLHKRIFKYSNILAFSCEKIVINTQSLRIFKYFGGGCSDLNLNSCSKLEVLHLRSRGKIEGLPQDICLNFPLLKTLFLSFSCPLTKFRIASPVLQTLRLQCIDNLMLDSAIDTPNLQSFMFTPSSYQSLNRRGFPSMNSTPQQIKIKLQTLYLGLDPRCVGNDTFLQLRNCIRNLPSTFIELSVVFDDHISIIQGEELKDIYPPSPSPPVNLLKLRIDYRDKNISWLVDRLLWSCHPETMSIVPFYKNTKSGEFIEALCDKFLNRKSKPTCCKSYHVKCWRHYLKDVKIEQLLVGKYLKLNFYMKW